MTNIYFVRHAEPNFNNHNDFERELSEKGLNDTKLVTDFLSDKSIEIILSSPYKRAVDTVRPFADNENLPVHTIDGFRERKVDNIWIEDFNSFVKKQWQDFSYKLSDGESLNEVQARNINALKTVLDKYKNKNIIVGSHGTALSTVINYYYPSFSCSDFEKIKGLMPFIVRFVFEGSKIMSITSFDLLNATENAIYKRKPKLTESLIKYAEESIIPCYDGFDSAHSADHANKVIENSMTIAEDFDVDPNMVYIIAAYHDMGLKYGRKDHEKNSRAMVLADEKLKQWFSDNEIAIIGEAVEEHRASSGKEPRSIYGKIVSEADKDITYSRILRRIIQYSLDNFPSYTKAQHYKRTIEHMEEKYGKNGYLKLWLNAKHNIDGLKEIQSVLENPDVLLKDFNKVYLKLQDKNL